MPRKPKEKTGLEKTIDDLQNQMANLDGADPEYAKMAKQLTKLYPLLDHDRKDKINKKVLLEVLLPVTANLVGIAMIVGHEQAHVVTSKALGFIHKLKA